MDIKLESLEDGQRLAAGLQSLIKRSERIMDHGGADHFRRIASAVAVAISRTGRFDPIGNDPVEQFRDMTNDQRLLFLSEIVSEFGEKRGASPGVWLVGDRFCLISYGPKGSETKVRRAAEINEADMKTPH